MEDASAFLAAGGAAALAVVAEAPEARPVVELKGLELVDTEDLHPDGVQLAQAVRAKGGTVVATGGCFDLLHAGHARTLLPRAAWAIASSCA